jgi:hypothetical protein
MRKGCAQDRAQPLTCRINRDGSFREMTVVVCCYGPLTATPELTGRSADVLQRQPPLAFFWNANAF